MEWVARFDGAAIGVDTAPLIYFIEDHPGYANRLAPLFEAVDQGRIRLVTSVVTLVEVLVRPLREKQPDLVKEYRDILLSAPGVDTVPVSADIAEQAAQLRAAHGLRTPDAIQVATAINARVSAFLTNDVTLRRVVGLELLLLADLPNA